MWKSVLLFLVLVALSVSRPSLEGEGNGHCEGEDCGGLVRKRRHHGLTEEGGVSAHFADFGRELPANPVTECCEGEDCEGSGEGSGGDCEGEDCDLDAGETLGVFRPRPEVYAPELLTQGLKVAFSVRKFDNLKGSGLLSFRDVLSNVGSGYEHYSGTFVAPRSGTYFFIFHAVGGRNSDFTVSLFRNDQYQVTAYGTRSTFEHGSNSAVLELRHGDSVALRLTQGELYEHPDNEAYTSFSGFLLF